MKYLLLIITISLSLLNYSCLAQATNAEIDNFIKTSEEKLAKISIQANRISWINANFLTDDTDQLVMDISSEMTQLQVNLALKAGEYLKQAMENGQTFDYNTKRKLEFLRGSITIPSPNSPKAADTLAQITTKLQSDYGKGTALFQGKILPGDAAENHMGSNTNPTQLQEVWESWHNNVGVGMREDYTKMVTLANQGAKELGFNDVGEMWRSGYDMNPQEFEETIENLWQEIKPLYTSLHCWVRTQLNKQYGDKVQPKVGSIRADLLGNMWGQEWGNLFKRIAPKNLQQESIDITKLLKVHKYDAIKMVKTGEGFFSSLGFQPLPETFWKRSLFLLPTDHQVVCHASAWDIDAKDDIRIKMCIDVDADEFVTIHHELGHNYYQRAYKNQSFLYQGSANDGFHEAIGDLVALSITPEYLKKINLIKTYKTSINGDLGFLLEKGLNSLAFFPFAYIMDKWRWGVFSGKISPENYNTAWNDLRKNYQGVIPPVERNETHFDPGAKYHIPGNTPYMRYFLARVLQFQFFEAACKMSEFKGPLHQCTFYGNKTVGEKLEKMLALGASQPWPVALKIFTGTDKMQLKSFLNYFAPLTQWLEKENQNATCGY